ncbi:MAG: type II toxin-antitoxin system VapC family toxin [Candidatus Thermoplasmatota archaeon]
MRELQYLFDTSAIIDMMREKKFERGAISVITVIEVLRGVKEGKRQNVKRLLEESFDVIGLETQVILTYCDLYSNLKSDGNILPDADLLVASSALAHDLTLKSGDKDFERLEDYGLIFEKI